jgi:N-acetylmuramoyl-L-alanine amidase
VKKSTTSQPPPVASGTVVVLDPGHNGGNASHPAEINRQVPAGRGQTKACNTTGTSTNAGYTEHAFTWSVATQVRDILTAHGVKVVMTRQSDTGVGPCVNERASTGNQAGAAAVVSIHADGSTSAGAHGFHVAYSSPPLNAAQGEPSLKLARTLRDGLRSAGFPTSNYIGSDGLSPRSDLGGLNLSERPTALVECGNMRDAGEAATLSSADGRAKYATAIANAILAYLS